MKRMGTKKKMRTGLPVPLWGLLATGLVFRILLWSLHHVVSFDEAHYLNLAASLVKGEWREFLHPYWPPGYPLITAGFGLLIRNIAFAGRAVNVLFGTLTLLPVYFMARRIFGDRTAFIAGLIMALYPPIAMIHTSAWAEPTFVFFGFLGVWLGWEGLERRMSVLVLAAGMAYGLSYLCKPEGVGFFAVYLVILVSLLAFSMVRKRKTVSWASLPLLVLGFGVFASFYLVYLHAEAGYWTFSAKGAANQQFHRTFFTPENDDVFRDLNEDNTSMPMDAIFHAGTFLKDSRGKQNAGMTLPYLAEKYTTHLFRALKYDIPSMMTLIGVILFGLGLFGMPWSGRMTAPAFYFLSFLGFYWMVLFPLFVVMERYLQSMFPAVVVWMGNGVVLITGWAKSLLGNFPLSRKRAKLWGPALTVFLLVGLSFIPESAKIFRHSKSFASLDDPPEESRQAGLWIRENAKAGEAPVIMSYNKGVDFYAGNTRVREAVSFPISEDSRVLAYARHKGVDYFVVEERYLAMFPNLVSWAQGAPPGSLVCVHTSGSKGGFRAWVFTWKDRHGAEGTDSTAAPERGRIK